MKNVHNLPGLNQFPDAISILLTMNRTDYTLKCHVTNQKLCEILHIEVKCKQFPEECYYRHFSFEELSNQIQTLFNNISHLYVYMNKQGCVYFDDYDGTLKVCVPIADEIRQFPIPLQSKGREEGLERKLLRIQQQKARMQDQFQSFSEQKTRQNQQLEKTIQFHLQQKQQLQNQQKQLLKTISIIQRQISELQSQSNLKMKLLRRLKKINEAQSAKMQSQGDDNEDNDISALEDKYKSIHSIKSNSERQFRKGEERDGRSKEASGNLVVRTNKELEERKRFWIKEVSGLKKAKTMPLKRLINKETKFQEENVIRINDIDLKKMLFVEVFLNLQILDLSQNHLHTIQGLQNLKKLLKLNLSQNKIDSIKGLSSNIRLVELNLSSNNIKHLQNIFHLTNLNTLSLSKNMIELIPNKIYKLLKLVQVHLDQNKVIDVSENVELLNCLKVFTINDNKCYSSRNRSKQIIDKLIDKGVKTTSHGYRNQLK